LFYENFNTFDQLIEIKMKKIITFILVLGTGLIHIQGQELVFHHSRNITLEDKKLSRPEIIQLMESTPQALQEYKSGKTLRTVGDVTLFGGLAIAVGGVLIDIYGEVGDQDPYHSNNTLSIVSLSVGGAMLIATIPLKIAGKKKIRQSVKDYNTAKSTSYLESKPQYNLSVISNNKGIGFRLTF
jgi:hypothetical protein